MIIIFVISLLENDREVGVGFGNVDNGLDGFIGIWFE